MAYYLPETASGQPNLTAKNRVWGFFGESVSVCLETRPAALEPHQENYAGHRETVSGIPLWPSRDPIGELGGTNLYGFVGNNGVGRSDALGLFGWNMGNTWTKYTGDYSIVKKGSLHSWLMNFGMGVASGTSSNKVENHVCYCTTTSSTEYTCTDENYQKWSLVRSSGAGKDEIDNIETVVSIDLEKGIKMLQISVGEEKILLDGLYNSVETGLNEAIKAHIVSENDKLMKKFKEKCKNECEKRKGSGYLSSNFM